MHVPGKNKLPDKKEGLAFLQAANCRGGESEREVEAALKDETWSAAECTTWVRRKENAQSPESGYRRIQRVRNDCLYDIYNDKA